jgi:hypothetical protein
MLFVLPFWKSSGCFEFSVVKWLALLVSWKLESWRDAYHAATNLSRKLDASLRYLQLQIGTPHNPITLDYDKWRHLAPLSWVKMLWRLLHHFNIHLHMECATNPIPRERDQVVMEERTSTKIQ